MIDPLNFEMPIDRLLTGEEEKLVNAHDIETDWVQCVHCRTTGATTDEREYCSIECFVKEKNIDPKSMDLLKFGIYEQFAAKKDDYVLYNESLMKVFQTDCTEERLRKEFAKTFSYVLTSKEGQIKLFDLEMPLRKLSFKLVEEENMENRYFKHDINIGTGSK
jgi:hypothetical protein